VRTWPALSLGAYDRAMERRIGLRARTDFGVMARNGRLISRCRGVEVSTTGLVLDRGRIVKQDHHPLVLDLELHLPERLAAIRALVRPVWSFGTQQALRIVQMHDVDRLNLAEHLDVLRHRGVVLS
jgi:hypothetical protein